MANHCYNWISFYGKKESLDKLAKALETYENFTSFNDWVDSMIEYTPPKNDERVYYHYGTKWFDFEIDDNGDEHMLVRGDSAWSPPLEMTRSLCEHFGVGARHEFEESGCDFGGYWVIQDNGYVSEELDVTYNHWRYMEDSHSYMDNLINDLEDESYGSIEELLEDNKFLSNADSVEIIDEWYKYQKQK
jgi:hypothetical protein